MIARWLGPHGKGLLASLAVIAMLIAHLCTVGLGDAAIVWVGSKRASLQRSFSATAGASIILAVIGMAAVWLTALFWFREDWEELRWAALIAAVGLPLYVWARLLSFMLNAQERVGAGSAVVGIHSIAMALALVLFVGWIPLGVTGGSIASVVGAAVALALGIWLNRTAVRFRASWDWGYLKPTLRYGALVESSNLLTFGFLRGDMLVVYSLAGSVAAGFYSVALTGGIMVGLLPMAISMATFPRVARLPELQANILIAQACRISLIAGVIPAAALAILTPVAMPLLFGAEFQASVTPALILIAGGLVWSVQWILCRAQAARGRPGLQLRAFAMSLTAMLLLDLLLVPQFGINGAAWAALIASLIGTVAALIAYRNASWWDLPLRRLRPGPEDVKYLFNRTRRLLAAGLR